MRKLLQRLLLVAGTLVALLVICWQTLIMLYLIPVVSTVMTQTSPDGKHTALLRRAKAIDLNFSLNVDGHRVYISDDFAPSRNDYAERIRWSKNSQAVVLSVEGKHLYGYQVIERRALTASELDQVEFSTLDDLGYEGEVPDTR
jgi:hypothetical protein